MSEERTRTYTRADLAEAERRLAAVSADLPMRGETPGRWRAEVKSLQALIETIKIGLVGKPD